MRVAFMICFSTWHANIFDSDRAKQAMSNDAAGPSQESSIGILYLLISCMGLGHLLKHVRH